jgi:NADH-quinone oxidoreductase subunit K
MMITASAANLSTLMIAQEAFGPVTLAHYLLLAAVLFVMGLIGFLSRRNMIIMFLCTELMFQAAAIVFIAFDRYYWGVSGQTFVIFILTIAAAEAALALALVVLLYRRRPTLDAEAWAEMSG